MKKIANLLLITFVSISITACNGQMNKQGGGTLIGGLAGGLLGSQFGGGEGKLVAVAYLLTLLGSSSVSWFGVPPMQNFHRFPGL